MKRLIIIGDSHCKAYRAAADIAGRTDIGGGLFLGAKTQQSAFFVASDDGITFVGKAAHNFKRYCKLHDIGNLLECRRSLVVSMGLAAASFYGSQDWRERFSLAPDSRIGRTIVSEAVVRQIVEDLQRPVLAFYDWLHRNELIFAAVASPRPQRRHPVVRELGAEKVLRVVALFEEPVRRRLAELGYPVVDAPDTTDDAGLLREEYWGHNWSHANEAYGKVVIEQLDRLVLQATGRSVAGVPD